MTSTTDQDRAITLLYSVPIEGTEIRWLDGPRGSMAVEPGRECLSASRFQAGTRRLGRWPLGAISHSTSIRARAT